MAAASSSSSAGGSPAHPPSPAGGAAGGGGGGPYSHNRSRFGDTTLTKVFVGGLAWETPSEGLRDHFQGYGEILEAVVITDRETGRSKGYGFVIFRDPEAAQRAVQNPNPVIAGRRANCNIASMGPSRPAPPRGRGGGGAGRGPHLPDQPPTGSPYRVPSLLAPPQGAAMFYPHQYGYWYPSHNPYQQALYNSQMLQHYYSQMYIPQSSPSGPSYEYISYMAGGSGPRIVLSPIEHAHMLFQQSMTPMEGSFQLGSSLPPYFRLQLPSHAVSRQSDDLSGPESTQSSSANAATNLNNEEASTLITSNSDPNASN